MKSERIGHVVCCAVILMFLVPLPGVSGVGGPDDVTVNEPFRGIRPLSGQSLASGVTAAADLSGDISPGAQGEVALTPLGRYSSEEMRLLFGQPIQVTTDTGDDTHPSMIEDGQGTMHIAFTYPNGTSDTDIGYATSTNGAEWSVGKFNSSDSVQRPDLDISPNGTLWLVFEDSSQDNVTGIYYSMDYGQNWYNAGIIFKSVTKVTNLDIDTADNGSAGALFLSGLGEFQGSSTLLVYYNDQDGALAGWKIAGFTQPLPDHSGPWLGSACGINNDGGTLTGFLGFHIQNGSDENLGVLFAPPWETSWSYTYFPDPNSKSGHPHIMTDGQKLMFLVGDVDDGSNRDILVLFSQDNANFNGGALTTPAGDQETFPMVYTDTTHTYASYFVNGSKVNYMDINSGYNTTLAASADEASRSQDIYLYNGQTVIAAWVASTAGNRDIYFSANDSSPPQITHTPVTSSPPNTAIDIQATVTDDLMVTSVKLFYKPAGSATFTEVNMTGSGTYSAQIPAADVKEPSLDYRIEAMDFGGNVAKSPSTGEHTVTVGVADSDVPQITHTPVTTASNNTAVSINATITDPTTYVSKAVLYYRKTNTSSYSQATMSNGSGGSAFTAQIPANYVTTAGVEYYIYAEDAVGNNATDGSASSPHKITVKASTPPPPPGETPQDNTMMYILIGVVIAVVIAALVAALLLKRKKSPAPPPGYQQQPPPPGYQQQPPPPGYQQQPPPPGYQQQPPPPGYQQQPPPPGYQQQPPPPGYQQQPPPPGYQQQPPPPGYQQQPPQGQ